MKHIFNESFAHCIRELATNFYNILTCKKQIILAVVKVANGISFYNTGKEYASKTMSRNN